MSMRQILCLFPRAALAALVFLAGAARSEAQVYQGSGGQGDSFASSGRPMLQGGVTQNQYRPNQNGQDRFSGGGDDRRNYVSQDGRWFDRCSYERDHPGWWDQQYGKPDHVPISEISSNENRKRYARCAVDSCNPNVTAVCWRNPSPPMQGGTGFSSPSGPPQSLNQPPARIGQPGFPPPGQPAGPMQVVTPCDMPPADLRQQLMQAATQMDQVATNLENDGFVATDRFFRSMAVAVGANLQFLAQRPGEPAAQMGQAIVDYLNNDRNANHAQLLQAAQRAATDLQRDPATFLGTQAGNVVFNAVSGEIAAGAGRACRLAASKVAKIGKAQQAARRLKQMQDSAKGFQAMAREGAGNPPGGGSSYGSPSRPPAGAVSQPGIGPMTPTADLSLCSGLNNMCVRTAIAQAESWERGAPVAASPHFGANPASPGFNQPMDSPQVFNELKQKYGNRPIPNISPDRQRLQAEGLPAWTTKQTMIDEIAGGGDGAQGIVFVQQTVGQPGHVFNVGRFDGTVYFKDTGMRMEAPVQAPNAAAYGGINPGFMLDSDPYRMYLYRVR